MASTLPVFNDVQNYAGTLTYVTTETTPGGTVDGEAVGWFKVANVTALRALPTDSDNKFAVVDDVGGYGGGIFRWDSTSGATDDGLTIIAPSDGGVGRWIKL